MTKNDIQEIFSAQTINIRELERAWKHINRSINNYYAVNDNISAKIHTNLLSLIYCAYAEATFSKLIHTPSCFTIGEISQIKSIGKSNIVHGWKKCIELALMRIIGAGGSHKPNTKKKLLELTDKYIYNPSLLRNKIAHGQWEIALNRNNTKVNESITNSIQSINVVTLYRYKSAFQNLSKIIEDIIESPNKTHHRDYWTHIVNFEEQQKQMMKWTLENKIKDLKYKKSLHKTKA